MEEGKKKIVGIQLAEKANQIWMSGKNFIYLTRPEFNVLFKGYNLPKPGEGKVKVKKKRLKEIVDEEIPIPFSVPLEVEGEARLACLKSETVSITDMVLGRNSVIKWSLSHSQVHE